MANRYTTDNTWLYVITSKTDEEMVLTALNPNTDHSKNYLGCIVSADRQTVYWLNDTQPLP